MHSDTRSGGLNISKSHCRDKARPGGACLRRLVTAGLLAGAGIAHALPVTVGWQVPLAKRETYILEIASEPGFAVILLNTEVTGKSYAWEAPSEGVYHWRLARPAQQGRGGDVATFVSGSFAVLDPATVRNEPARLSWDGVPGADRFKLLVLDARGRTSTLMTQQSSYVIPDQDTAVMIEVVPMTGTQRTFRDFHFNPSLRLETGVPPPPPPPPPAPVDTAPVAAADAPPAVVDAPADAAEPAATPPAEPAAPEPAPRRKRHQVAAYGVAGAERLRLQKLEVDLDTVDQVRGGGAQVWSNPWSGLIVGASGTYHEHAATVEQTAIFGANPIELDEARFTADMVIGWDLLSGFATERWLLGVGLAPVAAQAPFLPVDFMVSAGGLPDPEPRPLNLLGGTVMAGTFWGFGALTLEGGAASSKTDEAKVAWQRAVLDFYFGGRFTVQLGGLSRVTQAARCAASDTECLAQGKSRITAVERLGLFGLGVTLR